MYYAGLDRRITNNNATPKSTLNRLLYSIAVAVVCSLAFANYNPLYAADDCSKPIKLDGPFADLDDLLTEEEKREALHEELDRKLAAHKSPCDPTKKPKKPTSPNANAAPSANQQQPAQASDQNGSQGNNQNTAQSAQQNNAQTGDPGAPKDQQQDNATGQPGNSGRYSSPWANQEPSASDAGTVSLEPMADPGASSAKNLPQLSPEQQKGEPRPAAGLSSTEEQARPTGNQAAGISSREYNTKLPESQFLKRYGGQSEPAYDKIEDIANRHKSGSQYGYPGNTGTNQQNPNYSDPGRKPGQTTTINADDAVLVALKKRLENESDPEKRKEIQAEIDKYKKK